MKAIFSKDYIRFIFVEQNEFRNIVRLELKFKVPDENEYKKYLAETMSRMEVMTIKLKKENVQLKENLRNLEGEKKDRIDDFMKRNKMLDDTVSRQEKKILNFEKENADLTDERKNLKNRIIELEKESSTFIYEIEKYKIEEYRKEQELLKFKAFQESKEEMEK